jgi:hypothetical protein
MKTLGLSAHLLLAYTEGSTERQHSVLDIYEPLRRSELDRDHASTLATVLGYLLDQPLELPKRTLRVLQQITTPGSLN